MSASNTPELLSAAGPAAKRGHIPAGHFARGEAGPVGVRGAIRPARKLLAARAAARSALTTTGQKAT
ncbi:hypothetical protein [Streptomyces sp. NPDC048436]|uniref:hypothetical protein n=1 Tax=Streptomyces sp. NPDC048436 TaxID=3365550 RepID=UPI00371450B1